MRGFIIINIIFKKIITYLKLNIAINITILFKRNVKVKISFYEKIIWYKREGERINLKYGVLISFFVKKILSNRTFFFFLTQLYRWFSIDFIEPTILSNDNEYYLLCKNFILKFLSYRASQIELGYQEGKYILLKDLVHDFAI
jgi:hypothetical protein